MAASWGEIRKFCRNSDPRNGLTRPSAPPTPTETSVNRLPRVEGLEMPLPGEFHGHHGPGHSVLARSMALRKWRDRPFSTSAGPSAACRARIGLKLCRRVQLGTLRHHAKCETHWTSFIAGPSPNRRSKVLNLQFRPTSGGRCSATRSQNEVGSSPSCSPRSRVAPCQFS